MELDNMWNCYDYTKNLISWFLPHGFMNFYNNRRKAKIPCTIKCFNFEIHLADHCNLNCVGCAHFSPIADRYFYDIEQLKNDCERFSKIAKEYVKEVHLIGGEPLLHEKICETMSITRTYFDNNIIKLVTNGILLGELNTTFWESCHDNNIIVSLTAYPINLNFKKICDLAYKYNVCLEFFNNKIKYKFEKNIYDLHGTQNIEKAYNSCLIKVCPQLYEGRLYRCPPIPYIKYFNKQFGENLQVCDGDYLDLQNINSIETVSDFLNKPVPFCRYCQTEDKRFDIEWKISAKEISEWK